jgi:hypothetical protein
MFLARMVLVYLLVPLLVIVDSAAYNYIGTLPGHVVTILSVIGGIPALVWLIRMKPEDADPLHADRHPYD